MLGKRECLMGVRCKGALGGSICRAAGRATHDVFIARCRL
jgi:hypothetical protein